MTSREDEAAAEILATGFAWVRLEPSEADLLRSALAGGRAFFALPESVKAQHVSEDMNHGYRPMGQEYSVSAERPDLNECFALWSDRSDMVPGADRLELLLEAWAAYRTILDDIVEGVVTRLARHFGGACAPAFRRASYLQMNNYCAAPAQRDLLQDLHEDGHLVTVHYASGPGLEVRLDGMIKPLEAADESVLLMPGSVMTGLTSGAIQPLYHQVRDLAVPDRVSLMYFVNPSLDKPVHPWSGEPDTSVDLRDAIRSRPLAFGLPHVPDL
ncbi:2-oxoglutarate and iron-dependent oxygenase domain-containing protein [Streptomyces sp. NPDC005303]|uniref:2-oxoglutarate and iron-dependent oxygenase domain-containing protein n=1 Tax=Streptomyces sp. NPDC005303 TaxID=3155713 RepID=UPI0033A15CD8